MAEMRQVFIASLITAEDFHRERNAAHKAVIELRLRPWAFEIDLPATPGVAEKLCLAEIDNSDVFILILGTECSAVLGREYYRALQQRKHILVYRKGSDHKAYEPASKFLRKVKLTHVYRPFKSPAGLSKEIRESLAAWLNGLADKSDKSLENHDAHVAESPLDYIGESIMDKLKRDRNRR